MAAEIAQNVLIAFDDSEESENAFNFYVKNIHKPGNQLLLVHGAELPPIAPNEAAAMCQTLYDQLLETEKKRVKALEEKYANFMRSQNLTGKITAVFCSRPGELIVDIAEKENVLMIVMGTRGLGMIRRTILGSVSDYVLHHAHCPVTICRRHHHTNKQSTS